MFVTMALKSHDDQHDDKGEYRLDIWRPNLGKCQGLGGKIRRSEGYWKNRRHMITVNTMAIITRKKKKVDCCCYVLHKCNKHNLYPGIATFFTTHFIQQ